ncbi:hypothetical protein ABMA27_012157 [Loxostege sticticalis]|uniref:CCHC-type domain-containing protein n=1 Tax=Loxostege sticticalis TaxID=481309 RepID=A0ABR3IIX8_LOXSC
MLVVGYLNYSCLSCCRTLKCTAGATHLGVECCHVPVRTRDESVDSLSGAEEKAAPKKSATVAERRGRGRPVTTGARAKKAEARELLREDRRKARAVEAEEEAEGFSIKLKKALNMATYKVREQTAHEVVKAVRTATETIAHCTKKSGHISGIFQRNLNNATALIQAAVESLAERTVNDEIRRLNVVVERLTKENSELRKESAILKEQSSSERVVSPVAVAPMEVTPAVVEPSELERSLMAQRAWCSAMMNARIEGLEDRLLPEQRRIPLAADKKREARPSFAEVAGPSKATPAKAPATKAPPAKTPVAKAPAAKVPVAKAPAAKAPAAKAPAAKAPAVKAPAAKAPAAKAPAAKAPAAKAPAAKTSVDKAPTAKAAPAEASTSKPIAPASRRQGRSRARRSAPQRASAPATEARPLPPPPTSMEEGWTTVVKRGKKSLQAAPPPQSGAKPTKPVAAKPATPKLRPPRSSAIVLTLLPGAQEKGVTYETAIRDAKSRINLEELGISGLRFSKAKTGGKILEIPGAVSGDKADAFAAKLRDVLPEEIVRVTRPIKTVDIRLSGLDDSVTKEEVAAAVSKSGGCALDSVKVGAIRQSWSGSGTVVVKVPVTAAQKLSKGRLLVGWVSCRVQVLEAKPLRCYRCMEGGHVRGECPCETDRSELCYRCGRPGHQARECVAAAPHCPVCADLGKPADHKVGSKNCAQPKRGKASKPVPPRKRQPLLTAAQDILLQHMAEWLVDVAIVPEPYWVPPDRDNWVADSEGLTAVIVSSGQLELVARWSGFVVAKWRGMLVVGIYLPPRRTVSAVEVGLDRLTSVLRQSPLPALVAGDFNAKATAWGETETDSRGELVLEWAIASGLVLLNRGNVATCVRPQGESIVDLTFASPDVANRVSEWRVLTEAESLSDHRNIRFNISASPNSSAPAPPHASRTPQYPRWRVKAMDRDMLREAALVKSWLPTPSGPVPIDEEAEWFRGTMTQVCDASMPRAKALPPIGGRRSWPRCAKRAWPHAEPPPAT